MKVINVDKTKGNIRRAREKAGIPVRIVAAKLGVSVMAVYKWERLEFKTIPCLDNLLNLAEMFNTTVDALVATDTIN